MCLQVVEWLARYKPKQLAKSGTVRPVVSALCGLCAEPEPPEHDNDDQQSASKFAAQVHFLTFNHIILPQHITSPLASAHRQNHHAVHIR